MPVLILHANTPKFLLKRVNRSVRPQSWLFLGNSERHLALAREVFQEADDISKIKHYRCQVEQSNRVAFLDWLDEVSGGNHRNQIWLFASASLKNTFLTRLFSQFCTLDIVTKYKAEGFQPDIVIVDCLSIEKHLQETYHVEAQKYWFNSSLYLIQKAVNHFGVIRTIAGSSLGTGRLVACVRPLLGSKSLRDRLSSKNIVLVRNYLVRTFSDENHIFWAHQLPGLATYLKENAFHPVFLSIPTQISNPRELVKALKCAKTTVLLPEQFLSLAKVFRAAFRVIVFQVIYSNLNYDLQNELKARLLRDAISSANLTEAVFKAILYAGVGKNIADLGIEPRSVINWGENQSAEKGLLVGLRESYPSLEIVSVQPFIAPLNLLSIYPSRQDGEMGIESSRTLFLGPRSREIARTYGDVGKSGFCPAFRYAKRALVKRIDKPDSIIALLGYDFDNSLFCIQVLSAAWPAIGKGRSLRVRLHPAAPYSFEDLCKYTVGVPPEKLILSVGPLSEDIERIDWAICGATGVSVELALQGFRVASLSDPHFLSFNYLEHLDLSNSDQLWRLCFSSKELVEVGNVFDGLPKFDRQNRSPMLESLEEKIFAINPSQHWKSLLPTNNS